MMEGVRVSVGLLVGVGVWAGVFVGSGVAVEVAEGVGVAELVVVRVGTSVTNSSVTTAGSNPVVCGAQPSKKTNRKLNETIVFLIPINNPRIITPTRLVEHYLI